MYTFQLKKTYQQNKCCYNAIIIFKAHRVKLLFKVTTEGWHFFNSAYNTYLFKYYKYLSILFS